MIVLMLLLGMFSPSTSLADPEAAYVPVIEGVEKGSLARLLEQVSDTFALRDERPASLGLLEKRMKDDVEPMIQALRSEGYYQARVDLEINAGKSPVEAKFLVKTGERYRVRSLDVFYKGDHAPPEDRRPDPGSLGLAVGDPARSDEVLKVRDALVGVLQNRGYPFAAVEDLKVVVDHATRSVRVEIMVSSGPYLLFGEARVSGLEEVKEDFVLGRIAWSRGDEFRRVLLKETQERLLATGLFASAEISTGEYRPGIGTIPIDMNLKERKHRTASVGLRYRTDEGPGVEGAWRHRNYLGRGERLSFDATLSPDLIETDGVFRKPEFLRRDQSLLLEAGTGIESPEAYTAERFRGAAGLERRISKQLTVGAGLGFKVSRVDHLGTEETFALLSLPFRLDWDSSDDLLNPTKGGRLALEAAPFREVSGKDLEFFKARASVTRYLEIARDPSLVLAARAGLGAITGADRDEIPADERFFAGGGGSVRGLPYQAAGPLSGTDPVGGKSLFDISAELRLRITESLGLVGFLDGGSVFKDSLPDSDGEMFWGAGAGIRYFTFFGPLRMDLAVPLDRREGVDDAFQIYLSVGQAF
ncbi:MAG: autotransporter assembly complex protein TamA [Desulfobacteraceae bacterium]